MRWTTPILLVLSTVVVDQAVAQGCDACGSTGSYRKGYKSKGKGNNGNVGYNNVNPVNYDGDVDNGNYGNVDNVDYGGNGDVGYGDRVRITSLTLRYTGTNTGGSENSQGSLWGFNGDPATFPSRNVQITARSKTGTYGVYSVAPGQTFTVNPSSAFDSEFYLDFDGNYGARVFFHTSCSVPLAVGDRFGSFEVVCFTNDNGGTCDACKPVKECYEDPSECPTCRMCANGYKPTQLSLTYLGGPATLSNSQGGSASVSGYAITGHSAQISCQGNYGTVGNGLVSIGQSLTISNLGSAGSDITCTVTASGGTQTIIMHTSCSKSLNVGDRFGAITVTGFIEQAGYQTRSSGDPLTCPACKMCCKTAKLNVPNPIQLPCDGSMENHLKLQQWVASAKCVDDAGHRLKVISTEPLLGGANTCSVSSQVTFTCCDECGNVHKKSGTFSIVDNDAPEVQQPPHAAKEECNPTHAQEYASAKFQTWLDNHGGMTAIDVCQEATPCATNTFTPPYINGNDNGGITYNNNGDSTSNNNGQQVNYFNNNGQQDINYNANWNGAYGTSHLTESYAAPNVVYDSAAAYNNANPYFMQPTQSYRVQVQARTDSEYTNYACAYCPVQQSPCCANGITYNTPCHAHCAGVHQFSTGACGTQTNYNGGVITSYGNGQCTCNNVDSVVCARSGMREYANPCYANCAGEYDYFVGPCSSDYTNGAAEVQTYSTGCTHCTAYTEPCCGDNGQDYASPCHAACAGVFNFYAGRCTVYSPSTNCGNDLVWTHSAANFGACKDDGYDNLLRCAEVDFTASDVCGNSVTRSATYAVVDTEPPSIGCGQEFVWPCDDQCAGYEHWETDARLFLTMWIQTNGCLCAEDCSDDITWEAQNVPTYGNMCGASGVVTFAATDSSGNTATHDLKYSFPIPPKPDCPICGQSAYGSTVKTNLLELTVRYESYSQTAVTITVHDGNNERDVEPGMFAAVTPGQEIRSFASTGYSAKHAKGSSSSSSSYGGGSSSNGGSSNRFPTNTVYQSSLGGSVAIHTSCSVPLYVGQSFQFSDGSGSIVITGFRTDTTSSEACGIGPGTYGQKQCSYPNVCNLPVPPFPTYEPTPPPSPLPCVPSTRGVCASQKSGLRELIFRYVATNALTNTQEGKASVRGSISGSQISVSCSDGSTQGVTLGSTYILRTSASKFRSETQCTLSGNGVQRLEIHTSCSKVLNLNDQFGNLVLVGFRHADGTYVNNDNCPLAPAVYGDTDGEYGNNNAGNNNGGYDNDDGGNNNGGDNAGYIPPTPPAAYPSARPTPPPSHATYSTVLQQLQTQPQFSTFYQMLIRSKVADALVASQGPFTIFAPNNNAFAKLDDALLAVILNDMAKLAPILMYHIMNDQLRSTDISVDMRLTTFNGVIVVKGVGYPDGILLKSSTSNKANVVAVDILGTNGVIHEIDSVLLPLMQYNAPTQPYVEYSPPPTMKPTAMAPIPDSENCVTEQACESNGRLTSLTFRYVGYNRVSHQQYNWKKGYTNAITNEGAPIVKVRIMTYKKSSHDMLGLGYGKWSFMTKLNEDFTVYGDPNSKGKLKGSLVMTVANAKLKIQTNCGSHIGIGDQFGPVIVTGYTNTRGESCKKVGYGSQASSSDVSSSGGASSNGLSAVGIVGIVVGIVAVAVIMVGAVIFKRNKGKGWSSQTTH